MQITCLEMEKARRGMELKSARQRIAQIDSRLDEIEKSKRELLEAMVASGEALPSRLLAGGPKPQPERGSSGFRVRY
jgi:hypothetical protein